MTVALKRCSVELWFQSNDDVACSFQRVFTKRTVQPSRQSSIKTVCSINQLTGYKLIFLFKVLSSNY